MDGIEQIINDKLSAINYPSYEKLDAKTQKRLFEIENLVMNSHAEIQKLIVEIKKLKLSKSYIANSKNTSFTRKTVYNDKLLEQYIEKCIQDEDDYFTERKVEQLHMELKEIKGQYDKVLDNIIYVNVLRVEVENYKKEILRLTEDKEKIQSIIDEKDKIIKNLKNIMKDSNITNVEILPTKDKKQK
ncbi:hypothetical protein [Clostridium sp.]|jgi:hypothetical protein|uniref:hypothetical protein n=1 Tax=Clostridium sp. TaxID=1506 RepID=UPI0039F4FFCE